MMEARRIDGTSTGRLAGCLLNLLLPRSLGYCHWQPPPPQPARDFVACRDGLFLRFSFYARAKHINTIIVTVTASSSSSLNNHILRDFPDSACCLLLAARVVCALSAVCACCLSRRVARSAVHLPPELQLFRILLVHIYLFTHRYPHLSFLVIPSSRLQMRVHLLCRSLESC